MHLFSQPTRKEPNRYDEYQRIRYRDRRNGHRRSPPAMTRSRASAKQAGTRFETAIAAALAAALGDDRVERRTRNGAKDRGDVSGIRLHGQRVVLECKDSSRLCLPEWTAEAQLEAGHDDALVGLVVHKRHGVGDPMRQWVSMTLADFVAILTGQKAEEE
jgi:hypothetical protein